MSEFHIVVARKDGDAMRTPFVLGAQVGCVYRRRHVFDYGQRLLVSFLSQLKVVRVAGQEPGADFLCYLKSRFRPLS